MKKNFVRMALATTVISASLSFSAWAETIKDVKFEASIDLDAQCEAGIVHPEFTSLSEDYEILEDDPTTSNPNGKNEVTYKLVFMAGSENTFAEKADQITVSGTGITSIESKTVKDKGDTLEVKVKAYPYVKLGEPVITSGIDGQTITFNKSDDGANNYEYYIVYTDYDGEQHEKRSTTTKTSISVSNYNKEYKGDKEKNPDKDDMHIVAFYIRALSYNSAKNPNIVPGNWVSAGSAETDAELINYETWGDYITRGSSGSQSSPATQNGQIGPTGSSSKAGWSGTGNDWYWKNANGTNGTGWIWDGSNYYYCDPANGGKMKAGWFFDTSDSHWYYLNESHNGTYGCMLTGWQDINGKRYYLRPNAGGPMGSMIENSTVSINGVTYTFDASGALVR